MRALAVLAALLGTLLPIGCGGADFVYFESITSGPNPGATLIVVWMSDSPADDADALEVTVSRVELVGAGGSVLLASDSRTVDLLSLQNGVRVKLAETNVDPGAYDRVRITLVETGTLAPRVRTGGAWQPLGFLTPVAHVIEVPYQLQAAPDATAEIHVDFNVRTPLLDQGGDLRLDPRLDALDPAVAGTIAGTVRTAHDGPVRDAVVVAKRQGIEIRSTRTRPDGTFTLTPLEPGNYDLSVESAPVPIAPRPAVAVNTGDITTVALREP